MRKNANPIFHYELEILRRKIYDVFGGSTSWIMVVCTGVIFLIGNWLADGCKHLVTCFLTRYCDKATAENYTGWIELGSSVALLTLGWLWIRRNNYLRRITVHEHTPAFTKVLIVFLSHLSKEALAAFDSEEAKKDWDQFLPWLRLLKNSWEMPILALKYHQPVLERLYIVTSAESEKQKEQFYAIVHRFFPGLKVDAKQVDSFEDATGIYDTIERFYKDILAAGYRNSDIIMDITSGQKICSLIAGISTMTNGRLCQYVSTGTKEVLAYDIQVIKDNEK